MTMEQDILRLIEDRMSGLSKGQRAIGKYILTSPEEAAFLTASKLAQKVGVSESTVVRFALELAFDGYPSFQAELRKLTLSRLETTGNTHGGSLPEIKPTSFDGDIGRIQRTAEALNTEILDSAANQILQANRVHLCAFPGGDLLASYMAQRLRDLISGVQLHQFRDEREACQSLLDVERGDLVVVMGFLLPRLALERTIRILYHLGASVLLMTDGPDTQWHPYVKWLLTAVPDADERIRSLAAPISLINALLTAVLQRRDDRMSARFMQYDDIRRMIKR